MDLIGTTTFHVYSNGILFWAWVKHSFVNHEGERKVHTQHIEEFDNFDEADSRLYEWKQEFLTNKI